MLDNINLPKDLNYLCSTYLTDDEFIYYTNDWTKFDNKLNEVFRIGVTNGWLDLVEWALIRCESDEPICKCSDECINLKITKIEFEAKHISDIAAGCGNLDILKWIEVNDLHKVWNDMTCAYAALNGHLEVLKWLKLKGSDSLWTFSPCIFASQGGHLEVLKWLRSNGCDWSVGTCIQAVNNKRSNIIEWLNSVKCPCNRLYH